jgi:hypothetical protein
MRVREAKARRADERYQNESELHQVLLLQGDGSAAAAVG